ncbi:MAG: hypothetical protein PHQ89_02285 [Bacilli bacterium]|nr:hypothetical protein [Bacilli bacterium]
MNNDTTNSLEELKALRAALENNTSNQTSETLTDEQVLETHYNPNNIISDGGDLMQSSYQKSKTSTLGRVSMFLSNHTQEAVRDKVNGERGYADAIVLGFITAIAGFIFLVSIL